MCLRDVQAIPSTALNLSAGSSREQEEFERLRNALSTSQAEVSRLRTQLRSQELQNERNSEELNTYREALQKRDDENSSSRTTEDRNRAAAVFPAPLLLQQFVWAPLYDCGCCSQYGPCNSRRLTQMSLTRSRPSHAPSRIRPCASSAAAGQLQAAFRPGTLAARASVGKEPSRFPRAGAGHAKYPSAAATIPLIGEWRAKTSDVGGVLGTTQSSLAVATKPEALSHR